MTSASLPTILLDHVCQLDYVLAFLILLTALKRVLLKEIQQKEIFGLKARPFQSQLTLKFPFPTQRRSFPIVPSTP